MEVFNNFLARKVGVRTIPLNYVTRTIALAIRPASMYATDLSHAEEYVSIEDNLVALALHTHTLYCEDNADVHFSLEEATRGALYASSLKPFQQVKNDRGTLASIKQQFVGADKWQAELFLRDKFLRLAEWKCQTLYPLEKFVGQHRGAYISMEEVAEDVSFQLPNKLTRVRFLLAAIKCSDAGLQDTITNIRSNADETSATSKRHYFELVATYLLPFCP
eukprot:14836452-Ditylum_brightwellii.AAC.2